MEVWDVISAVLSGLIICIPLVIKLIQVTREAVRKGNWDRLVGMVAEYMAEAERKIADSATRKEWVIGMIRTSAGQLDYDITESEWVKISDMIDQLCAMAKIVNAEVKEVEAV